ncbi:MAG: 3-deoxy-7-phosphoheptulonate synthase [Gammaproteobacteria bacterium]
MSYTIIKKLPPIEDIFDALPLKKESADKIARDKQEIKDILSGNDDRLIVVVGPCSAWPSTAVLDYARQLQTLNTHISDVLKIVMRVYIQKPRTKNGWTGPMIQSDPFSAPDVAFSMRYVRKMMLDVIDMGLPISDEALFTHNAKGFVELLSWVAIGARSAENQQYRIYASSIDCPVGLKNPTYGSLHVGVNSVIAAQHPHVTVMDGFEVQTHGNPYAHLVLRGGNNEPNYSAAHLHEARTYMMHHNVKNPAILVDASHDNCIIDGQKNHLRQSHVIFETLDTMAQDPVLRSLVKGFMIESFIKDGNQKVDLTHPEGLDLNGLSITDPCLGWDKTETLLLNMAERLRT